MDDNGVHVPYPAGIKAIREANGMTCEQFGRVIEFSRRTVEGWEGGKRPSVGALNAISRFLQSISK